MSRISPKDSKQVDAFTHDEARRANIPTAEFEPVMRKEDLAPVRLSYQKRNPDLDPQLVWRGKYDGDDTLTVQAPPLYIQEHVLPDCLFAPVFQEFSRKGKIVLVFSRLCP